MVYHNVSHRGAIVHYISRVLARCEAYSLRRAPGATTKYWSIRYVITGTAVKVHFDIFLRADKFRHLTCLAALAPVFPYTLHR